MSQTMAPEVGPKPLLRGWTHLVSFPVWLIVGVSMLLLTDTSPVGRALLSVYVGGTAIMFGVSAMYHRGRWQPRAKALMQKFDRSAIFLAIAGGYTPMAWVSLHGTIRVVVVAGAWVGAALGIALHWVPRVPRAWRGASYIIVSWTAVLVF
ncbi:MAG: hemolysin III family protein, partial [Actinobacteria bacterium]|nr:hemolysin III family protein [Actinomycetota bacterium]